MNSVFFTQGSREIGYGHLFECLSIADSMKDSRPTFFLNQSSNAAVSLVQKKGYNVVITDTPLSTIGNQAFKKTVVIMNTRLNELYWQNYFRARSRGLVLIDELGNLELDCDVLVNFSINEKWLNTYRFTLSPLFCLGTDFYPARKEFLKARNLCSKFSRNRVMISLGGADRTRTTLRLASWLANVHELRFTWVIGPGFDFGPEVFPPEIQESPDHTILVNPVDFAGLLASHDCVVSSGGNTLYEAALVGTPSLVIWEDEHERVQGEAFQKKGVSLLVGSGISEKSRKPLFSALNTMTRNAERWKAMSDKGKKLVDGNGCERIREQIYRLAS